MKLTRLLGGVLAWSLFLPPFSANAALILTIDNYTTDELSFTISGSFDADTVGQSPGILAIKNDWSNNTGTSTALFSTAPAITFNSIMIGSSSPNVTVVQDGIDGWMDNIHFVHSFGSSTSISAGTAVSGSVTLSLMGAFDPLDAATLELVSGFSPTTIGDWARFEASAEIAAVPVPAAIWLFGSGLLGLVGLARHKKV